MQVHFFGYRSDICTPIPQVKYFKEESKGFDAKFLQENMRFAITEEKVDLIVTVKSCAL